MSVIREFKQCRQSAEQASGYLLRARFLFGLFSDPEDGEGMFLINFGWLSTGIHCVVSQKI
jgi:hypothetical protein